MGRSFCVVLVERKVDHSKKRLRNDCLELDASIDLAPIPLENLENSGASRDLRDTLLLVRWYIRLSS